MHMHLLSNGSTLQANSGDEAAIEAQATPQKREVVDPSPSSAAFYFAPGVWEEVDPASDRFNELKGDLVGEISDAFQTYQFLSPDHPDAVTARIIEENTKVMRCDVPGAGPIFVAALKSNAGPLAGSLVKPLFREHGAEVNLKQTRWQGLTPFLHRSCTATKYTVQSAIV